MTSVSLSVCIARNLYVRSGVKLGSTQSSVLFKDGLDQHWDARIFEGFFANIWKSGRGFVLPQALLVLRQP